MSRLCVVVLGGPIKDSDLFKERLVGADEILVADSGARHLLALGLMPTAVYGDMDSLSVKERETLKNGGCQFYQVPAEKNDTDGSLVIKEALAKGYETIIVWGALGNRPDHSFANIMLLQLGQENQFLSSYPGGTYPELLLEDGGFRVFLPTQGQIIQGVKGDIISLFALSDEVKGFASEGLKYSPANNCFTRGFPVGVSNELTAEEAWFTWTEGRLLCMLIKRGEDNEL